MKFQLKRFRGKAAAVDYIIPAVSIGFLLVSTVTFAYTLMHLRNAVNGDDFWRAQAPTVSVVATPLTPDAYKDLATAAVTREHISVEPQADRITVRAVGIADLQAWKDSVSDLMVLSPDLTVKTVCAGSSTCSGGALVAELTGSKSTIAVK